MNDSLEVQWFKNVSKSVVEEMKLRDLALREFYEALDRDLLEVPYQNVYCACFSQVRDDLSQWRAYADDGRGVAVKFDLERIQDANQDQVGDWLLDFHEVEYDVRGQELMAEDVIKMHSEALRDEEFGSARDVAKSAYQYLSLIAPRCKNPAFKGEREIRLLVQSFTPNDTTIYDEAVFNFAKGLGIWERNGVLVPYTEVEIPTEAISEVVLGPRFGGLENEAAVKLLLTKYNFKTAQISTSEASYR
ncbi:MAG: DUF2971 domain-containing protein [Planctomycetota bacterium]|nr:DUF2971 domain-containing protein [Planctomycetota bacterium]